MAPRTLPGLVAVLLLAVGSATACGTEASTSSAAEHHYDAEREWTIAGDEHATADEIIDAGRPADVGTSGGRTLITWLATPEDDEGPSQGAWRLYDADGKRVADGKLGIVFEASAGAGVVPVDDGFVIDNYTKPELIHVAPSGQLTPIPLNKQARPTRAGDLLVREWSGDVAFYRPADHAAYRLPRVPREPQAVRLDDNGTVWVMLLWEKDGDARIASAPGGVAPWTTEVVDLPDRSTPTIDMAYAGGELMFPQRSSTVAEYDEFQAIWRRSTDPGTGKAAWHSIPLDKDQLTRTVTVGLTMTDQGRMLVSGESTPALLENADGSLTPLHLPDKDQAAQVQPVGDRLYANAWQEAELYVSDDLGKTWSVVAR